MSDLSLFQLFLIELALLAIALAAAWLGVWQEAVASLERSLSRLAQRPRLCFAAIVGGAVLLRLALLAIEPVPMPLFHDEFSYLLGEDTFFHGRLTNPQLPVPIAFETIHTNSWPSYESMYMPGTAIALTVGRVLGSPWLGVLLVTALFCGALYWMASAWLPRSYAVVAGILGIAITGGMNWWFDNYFCIALASLGSALVLGSVPRIASERRWQATWPLGVGLLILMFTRPYEGFCVAFPCVLVLVWKLRDEGWKRVGGLALVPVAVLVAGFAWLLYYNWRGTGDPLLFPYMVNFRQYHITGPFLFSVKHPIPSYHLDIMRRFYIFAEVPQYDFMRNHPWFFLAKKITVYYLNFMLGFGIVLVSGLWYLLRRVREGLLVVPLLAFAGFAINVVLMAWSPFPQYAAPAAPLLVLIVMFGFLSLRRMRFGRLDGVKVARGLVLAELMLGLSVFGYRVSESRDFPEPQYVSKDRARIAAAILSHPGLQLCLVRYTPSHESWQEWVFNGADPERDRLVWARSLGPETDREVIAAFPGRQVWMAKPDYPDDLLSRYSAAVPYPLPDYVPPSLARH